jgi:hypothetical protein
LTSDVLTFVYDNVGRPRRVYVNDYDHVHVHVNVNVCVYVNVHVYVNVCVYVNVHVYVDAGTPVLRFDPRVPIDTDTRRRLRSSHRYR